MLLNVSATIMRLRQVEAKKSSVAHFFVLHFYMSLNHIGNNQSIGILSNLSQRTPPISPSSLDQHLSYYPSELYEAIELYESKIAIFNSLLKQTDLFLLSDRNPESMPFGEYTTELFTVWTNEKMPFGQNLQSRGL